MTAAFPDLKKLIIPDAESLVVNGIASETLMHLLGDINDRLTTIGAYQEPVIPDPPDPPVWKLIETRSVAGVEDFADLDGYQEVGIILRNVGASASGLRAIRTSNDNGSTFKSTSGDYYKIADTIGGINALTELNITSIGSTSGAYGSIFIKGFSLAAPKWTTGYGIGNNYFIADTTPLNAIRLFNASSGTPNSGTAYLLGLPGLS